MYNKSCILKADALKYISKVNLFTETFAITKMFYFAGSTRRPQLGHKSS